MSAESFMESLIQSLAPIKQRSSARGRTRTLAVQHLETRKTLDGTTYFVDSLHGNDAFSGDSESAAWASLSRLESQPLSPGDRVRLRRGSHWTDRLDIDDSGTAEEPILISSYGNGAPPIVERLRITGSHTVFDHFIVDQGKQAGDAVNVRSAQHVTLRNMEIRNGLNDGVDIDDADGFLIEDSLIHHFLAGSFDVQVDAHGIVATDTNGITIRRTEIHHVSGDSFQADPDRDGDITTNVLIEDSHFWTSPLTRDFNDSWSAGQRPGENAIDTKVVKQDWDSIPRMQLTVRNMTAHGWARDGYISNKAAFNIKEKVNAVFDGVTVYDNEIAFRVRGTRGNANLQIVNGVIYDNEKAIRAEDDLANLQVHHSTFGNGNLNAVQFAGGSGGVGSWDWRNNAFLDERPAIAAEPSNILVTADDFVDASRHDYRLTADSLLIDTGVLVDVQSDRDGNPRPQGDGPDIGAYESGGSDPNDDLTLMSFRRHEPSNQTTHVDTLTFTAEFNRQAFNVDATDFSVSGGSSAIVGDVAVVQGTGEVRYQVSVQGGDLGSFNGTVGLDLMPSNDIVDANANPLSGSEPSIDETFLLDNVAPEVTAIRYVGGISVLRSIVIDFSENVSLLPDAFSVVNSEGTAAGIRVTAGGSSGRVVLEFSGALADPSGSLPDGFYTLTIDSQHVRDEAGNDLLGDPVSGGNMTDEFYRLFGDSDGDGDVDGRDLGRFGESFLTRQGDANFNPAFDMDADGDVDGNDYRQFVRRLQI